MGVAVDLLNRLHSIFLTAHPFERDVLLLMSALRSTLIAMAAIGSFYLTAHFHFVIHVVVVIGSSWLAALISADFIEHYLLGWTLGYYYNPRVMSIGELERYNGPVSSAHPLLVSLWDRHKHDLLYFKVLPEDIDDLTSIGYSGIQSGTYFRALWEGDPGPGRFGGE